MTAARPAPGAPTVVGEPEGTWDVALERGRDRAASSFAPSCQPPRVEQRERTISIHTYWQRL